MSADPLSAEVIERICRHMNDDHQDAVIAYARHYGGISHANKAQIISLSPQAMELVVDGNPVQIPFDHILTDSEDAHKTLVGMLKAMPKPTKEPS